MLVAQISQLEHLHILLVVEVVHLLLDQLEAQIQEMVVLVFKLQLQDLLPLHLLV